MGRRKKLPGYWRVAAAQMKFAETIDGNLEKIQRAVANAAGQGADVVLFPECAMTGYGFDFSSLTRGKIRGALNVVSHLAKHYRVNVLVGSPV